ncbi:MAG: hypothetical protein K2F63_02250, partial [Muribaculaceae bacterium]|nr:hypothetical protein [Muribaculaceae bacterium]
MMHSKGKVETETILADMAQQMLRQHQAGYKWRDILVLVRFRREAVAIVNYLTAFYPSIRILSDEALLLNNSEAVRTVMSMVRMVHRSYNEALTAADADNARYGSADDIELMETRFNYYLANGSDVAQALELALRGADDAPGPVDEVAAIRSRNPANLVALIESVIALKLTPEQRESEYAYLAALQDLAVKHCEGSDPSVRAFLEAYDRNIHKWAIKAPSDIDAVQIMTIHKSKGLERACVHIPMAGWNIFARNKIDMWLPLDHGYRDMLPDCVPPALYMSVPVSSGLMSDPGPYGQYCRERFNENIIDSLNLCYVAFTRAARELNVYFSAGSSEATEMGYYIQRALRSETGGEPEASTMDLRLGLQSEKDACYADFNDIYIYGSPTVPEKKEPEPDSPVNGAGHYPVVFRDDTRELTSIDNDLFATRTDEFGDEDYKEITDPAAPFTASPEMEAAARRGNHLHSILGDMRTLDDLDRALERAAVRFGLDHDERSDYRRLITEAFRSAGGEASRWFDPGNKVFAERSIYISATDESFRPDRVVLTPDGRTVVV